MILMCLYALDTAPHALFIEIAQSTLLHAAKYNLMETLSAHPSTPLSIF